MHKFKAGKGQEGKRKGEKGRETVMDAWKADEKSG